MRGSAAVRFTIAKFTVWRFAVALVGLAVMVVWTLWLTQLGVAGAKLVAALAGVAGATAWLARPLLQASEVSIRWDGEAWYVGSGPTDLDQTRRGEVQVYLDVGAWLLLRFIPEDASPGVGANWLPVQRQGSPQDWHALRCALYAPRPMAPAADKGGAAR